MSDNEFMQGSWGTYLLRLIASSIPVALIAHFTLRLGEHLGLSMIPKYILLLMILLTYVFTFEERYVEPWRREPTSLE